MSLTKSDWFIHPGYCVLSLGSCCLYVGHLIVLTAKWALVRDSGKVQHVAEPMYILYCHHQCCCLLASEQAM